jgi:hypothetical protein
MLAEPEENGVTQANAETTVRETRDSMYRCLLRSCADSGVYA